MLRFAKARPEDQTILANLLWENGMEYTDPIDAFMLAWQDKDLVGCGRIEEYPEVAMLRPLVIAKEFRKKGIGRLLLERILPAGKPTVIAARGESVSFYTVNGFTHATWREIPINQTNECLSCPDRTECLPQPMIHRR